MNKKGMKIVGEHVINLIAAVLCILVLIYVGFQVYSMYIGQQQKAKQAEATIGIIDGAINSLKDGENAIKVIESPEGWFIQNFKNDLPQQCQGKPCICICNALNNCNAGLCKESKVEITIKNQAGAELAWIKLEHLPIQLSFTKNGGVEIIKNA